MGPNVLDSPWKSVQNPRRHGEKQYKCLKTNIKSHTKCKKQHLELFLCFSAQQGDALTGETLTPLLLFSFSVTKGAGLQTIRFFQIDSFQPMPIATVKQKHRIWIIWTDSKLNPFVDVYYNMNGEMSVLNRVRMLFRAMTWFSTGFTFHTTKWPNNILYRE